MLALMSSAYVQCMMTSSNGNVRGIRRSPVNSPHKGQWRGALIFSLICVWINGWVNNRKAGDMSGYRAHYDVSVMVFQKTDYSVFSYAELQFYLEITWRMICRKHEFTNDTRLWSHRILFVSFCGNIANFLPWCLSFILEIFGLILLQFNFVLAHVAVS